MAIFLGKNYLGQSEQPADLRHEAAVPKQLTDVLEKLIKVWRRAASSPAPEQEVQRSLKKPQMLRPSCI